MTLETLGLRQQSWEYASDVKKIGKVSVRVHITRNAYDFQSSIVTKMLNREKMEWNVLDQVPFNSQLKCFAISYVGHATMTDFRPDAEMMFARAKKLLG